MVVLMKTRLEFMLEEILERYNREEIEAKLEGGVLIVKEKC